MPTNQRLITFIFVALSVCLISLVSLKHTAGDFDVYYNSSHAYLNGAPVYVPHGGIEEFKYSPLFALLFSPLTLMSKTSAFYTWTVLNILFLFGILYLLYKLRLVSFNSLKDLLLVICLLSLTGRYIFANFKLGQANVLLCFLMALTMYFEINKRYFWASVALAFSLMIKFFPLLFVFYYLLRKRFGLLAYTCLMIVVFLFLPSIYSGYLLNLKYLHNWLVLLRSAPPAILYSFKNYSLLSFFSWVFVIPHDFTNALSYLDVKKGPTPEVYLAWGASCFAFLSLFFYDTLFMKTKNEEIVCLDYSCLFVCGLLFNPLAYLNALTFLFVPYFFMLRYLFNTSPNRKYQLICGSLVFASFILTILDNKLFFKNTGQFYAFLEIRPLMWAIILVYASLWAAKFSIIQANKGNK